MDAIRDLKLVDAHFFAVQYLSVIQNVYMGLEASNAEWATKLQMNALDDDTKDRCLTILMSFSLKKSKQDEAILN